MQKTTIIRLLKVIRPFYRKVIFLFILAFVQVGATLTGPIVTGKAIDYIIGYQQVEFNAIVQLLGIFIAIFATQSLTQWWVSNAINKLSYTIVKQLRDDAITSIINTPLKMLDGQTQGDYISRVITDVEFIANGLLQGFAQLFTGVLTIIGTLVFMFSINVYITLLVLILTPISLLIATFIAKISYTSFQKQAQTRGVLSGMVEENIGSLETIQQFTYEPQTLQKFKAANQELYEYGWKAQFYSALTNPSTRLVNNIVYAIVGLGGALAVVQNSFSIGALSAFLTYANQYMKPFNEISGVVTELQAALSSAQRVFEVIDAPREKADNVDAKVISSVRGDVKLNNVAFSYQEDKPFITDLSIHAKEGQTVAIVGPTGCGKTTLINLLMRFYEIDQGAILLDDTNIHDMTKASMRGQYGMVLQDSWLFQGTIKDNIAYGNPDASLAEIKQAAMQAHIHHYIEQLPQGYDTIITDDNSGLSQGQKQLLCIARVMLLNPAILILDEATSNIDTRTEVLVQQAFEQMMQGRTAFIIAHRLSTIRNADKIIVMQDGQIIETGSHEELLQQKGFYEHLYNSQFVTA